MAIVKLTNQRRGELDANSNRIIGVSDGTGNNDAVNVGQLNTAIAGVSGGTNDNRYVRYDAAQVLTNAEAIQVRENMDISVRDLDDSVFFPTATGGVRIFSDEYRDNDVLLDTSFFGNANNPNAPQPRETVTIGNILSGIHEHWFVGQAGYLVSTDVTIGATTPNIPNGQNVVVFTVVNVDGGIPGSNSSIGIAVVDRPAQTSTVPNSWSLHAGSYIGDRVIAGFAIESGTPQDNEILKFDSATQTWVFEEDLSGGGTTDGNQITVFTAPQISTYDGGTNTLTGIPANELQLYARGGSRAGTNVAVQLSQADFDAFEDSLDTSQVAFSVIGQGGDATAPYTVWAGQGANITSERILLFPVLQVNQNLINTTETNVPNNWDLGFAPSPGGSTIDDLSDLPQDSATTGQVIKWSGTEWEAANEDVSHVQNHTTGTIPVTDGVPPSNATISGDFRVRAADVVWQNNGTGNGGTLRFTTEVAEALSIQTVGPRANVSFSFTYVQGSVITRTINWGADILQVVDSPNAGFDVEIELTEAQWNQMDIYNATSLDILETEGFDRPEVGSVVHFSSNTVARDVPTQFIDSPLTVNAEGEVLYNGAEIVTDLSSFSTTNLSEGTNLYYTDARVHNRINTEVAEFALLETTLPNNVNDIVADTPYELRVSRIHTIQADNFMYQLVADGIDLIQIELNALGEHVESFSFSAPNLATLQAAHVADPEINALTLRGSHPGEEYDVAFVTAIRGGDGGTAAGVSSVRVNHNTAEDRGAIGPTSNTAGAVVINLPEFRVATDLGVTALAGVVPGPASSERNFFLRGDGEWVGLGESAGLATNVIPRSGGEHFEPSVITHVTTDISTGAILGTGNYTGTAASTLSDGSGISTGLIQHPTSNQNIALPARDHYYFTLSNVTRDAGFGTVDTTFVGDQGAAQGLIVNIRSVRFHDDVADTTMEQGQVILGAPLTFSGLFNGTIVFQEVQNPFVETVRIQSLKTNPVENDADIVANLIVEGNITADTITANLQLTDFSGDILADDDALVLQNGATGSDAFFRGDINKQDASNAVIPVIETNDGTDTVPMFTGNVDGNVDGDLDGNVVGNVTGDIMGAVPDGITDGTFVSGTILDNGTIGVLGTGAAAAFTGDVIGNAATATNVPYTGLTGDVPIWNQDTTGNAATATQLQTARSFTVTGDVTTPPDSPTTPAVSFNGLGDAIIHTTIQDVVLTAPFLRSNTEDRDGNTVIAQGTIDSSWLNVSSGTEGAHFNNAGSVGITIGGSDNDITISNDLVSGTVGTDVIHVDKLSGDNNPGAGQVLTYVDDGLNPATAQWVAPTGGGGGETFSSAVTTSPTLTIFNPDAQLPSTGFELTVNTGLAWEQNQAIGFSFTYTDINAGAGQTGSAIGFVESYDDTSGDGILRIQPPYMLGRSDTPGQGFSSAVFQNVFQAGAPGETGAMGDNGESITTVTQHPLAADVEAGDPIVLTFGGPVTPEIGMATLPAGAQGAAGDEGPRGFRGNQIVQLYQQTITPAAPMEPVAPLIDAEGIVTTDGITFTQENSSSAGTGLGDGSEDGSNTGSAPFDVNNAGWSSQFAVKDGYTTWVSTALFVFDSENTGSLTGAGTTAAWTSAFIAGAQGPAGNPGAPGPTGPAGEDADFNTTIIASNQTSGNGFTGANDFFITQAELQVGEIITFVTNTTTSPARNLSVGTLVSVSGFSNTGDLYIGFGRIDARDFETDTTTGEVRVRIIEVIQNIPDTSNYQGANSLSIDLSGPRGAVGLTGDAGINDLFRLRDTGKYTNAIHPTFLINKSDRFLGTPGAEVSRVFNLGLANEFTTTATPYTTALGSGVEYTWYFYDAIDFLNGAFVTGGNGVWTNAEDLTVDEASRPGNTVIENLIG